MTLDFALLILRVVVGLLFIGHGSQKLFGWFGGPGLQGVTGWLGSMGLQPARFWAMLAGLSEFGGGVLLLFGFLNPLGPLGIIAAMTFAIAKVHLPKGIWVANGGMEYPLTLVVVSGVIALIGSGAYSFDAVLGWALPAAPTFFAGIVAILIVTAIGSTMSNQTAKQKNA